MYLYLVRHFESEKNLAGTLSTTSDNEPLTEVGKRRCEKFTRPNQNPLILTSSSSRSQETAEIITAGFPHPEVRVCPFLRSTNAGPFAGLSSAKIRRANRNWYDSFIMYKAGLLNMYEFESGSLAIGAESKRAFEHRVLGGVLPIISEASDRDLVIIGNRSSITAILLYFARRYYGYPRGFYGYVRVSLGAVTIIRRLSGNGWQFVKVNARSPRTAECDGIAVK